MLIHILDSLYPESRSIFNYFDEREDEFTCSLDVFFIIFDCRVPSAAITATGELTYCFFDVVLFVFLSFFVVYIFINSNFMHE